MSRKSIIILLCILLTLLFSASVTFAWLSDTLIHDANIESYIHKSYFESGDGTSANQYQTYDSNGDPVINYPSEEGCAFEIKYPVQLYYFAWLQALGYFNVPNEDGTTIDQVYFYLSDDLDMTGWVLPQVGTQTYPFVGNFDGNGHTISNLTVQNVEGTGTDAWTDKPENISGLNIVGFFGVVGSLNPAGSANAGEINGAVSGGNGFTPTSGYTYDNAVNEVKNLILEDTTIKTDLSDSLAGIAAGYVNGTMENVKVVGGTLHSTAATALTEYTTNLSDFGAVGYCTDPYKGRNEVVTVRIYDPQIYTSDGGGSQSGQGNQWGGSVEMQSMYENLRGVYATATTNGTYATAMTVTHHTDGTVTETVTNTGTAPLATQGYPIRVTEVDDNGSVIASYSLVQRNDSADFVYLYGENVTDTLTQAVTDVYEKDSFYIYHDNDTAHNLTFNGTAFSDGTRANATKWVIEDSGTDTKVIYAIIGNTKYYLKNDAGTLSFTSGAVNATVPSDATEWTVTNNTISSNGRFLCFYNNEWRLLLQDRLLITDDYEESARHYLTVVNGAYQNTMVKADAVSWVKTMVSDDPDEDDFYLSTQIGNNTYYLKNNNGELALEVNPSTPSTMWRYKAATETEKSKVYTVINDEGDGYALYYESSEDIANWALTDFSEVAAGSGVGDSFGDSIDMKSIYNRLSAKWDTANASHIQYVSSETIYYDVNGEEITDRRQTTYSNRDNWFITTKDDIGSYTFARYQENNTTTKQFLYLYGDDTITTNTVTKTTTIVRYSDEETYLIKDGTHYLRVTTNGVNDSDLAGASKWKFDAGVTDGTGGTVSAQINDTTYYLYINNGNLAVSTTARGSWVYENGELISGGYWLVYENGWSATDVNRYFLISDGNGNYLRVTGTNTTSFANTTNLNQASRFYISGGTIYTVYNDTNTVYLRNDNGNFRLTTNQTNASSWSIGSDQIRNGNYYLYNNNGTWALKTVATSITISDGNGNYLYRNNTAIGNTTVESQATRWTLTANGSNYYLSNGNYYLRNNNGTLSLTTANNQRTSWTVGSNSISNGNYSLAFSNSSWSLVSAVSGYTISYNGIYLNAVSATAIGSGNSVSDYTDGNGNTIWVISNYQTSGEIGTISTYINGTRYYLYLTRANNSGTLSLSTSSTSWRNWDSGNIYYRTSQGGTYYNIQLNGSTWGILVGNQNTAGQILSITSAQYVPSAELSFVEFSDVGSQTLTEEVLVDVTVDTELTSSVWANTTITTSAVSYELNPTYFPLSLDGDGNIDRRNTGYVVSGTTLGTAGEELNGQAGKGDIRVSHYPISSGDHNISNSVTNYRLVTTSIRTIDGTNGDHTLTDAYVSAHFKKYADDGETQGSFTKMNAVLSSDTNHYVYGLHFMNAAISEDDLLTISNAKVNGRTYPSFEVPRDSIDFTLKERGYINFFAGTYFSGNNSFFSLHKIERNDDGTIGSIKEILEIYGDGNKPYIYKLKDKNGTITYESWEYYPSGAVKQHATYTASEVTSNGYSSLFNTDWIKRQSSLTTNAVYYFEIPVDRGEYALGSVDGGTGAYLMYLDIGTSGTALKPEGNARLEEISFNNLTVLHSDAGIVSYTLPAENRNVDFGTNPTFYPLAWNDAGTAVADTNTGYVISGANAVSNPPGDIRVSRYTKYAQGNWASIRNSLTSANNAGILNNSRVYTIVNGAQQSITDYGIGNQYTMQYQRISQTVNGLLENEQYVYGLHFMQSTISAGSTVTVPKAVINGVTYTDYVMPQDCIDFNVRTRGRIAFMAGTYFSGSQGTQSFFSLHRVFRDSSNAITDVKELSEIYSDGNASHLYIYRYTGDSNYYYSDGTSAGASVPSGYQMVYDLRSISNPAAVTGTGLTQNSVYYFEIPADPGEFALGSSSSDGAYLIYLDIAANAQFTVQTVITEVTEERVRVLNYPEGVAFVDAADSVLFDDSDGKADPEKSVFLSIPISNSNGDTVFAIDANADMTVTNTTSSLAGYQAISIPEGGSLTVNGGTPETFIGRTKVVEKVTSVDSDTSGTTTQTVTITTQSVDESGTVTTTVEQTVTTTLGSNSTTVTTDPAPAYDGHTLIPKDMTSDDDPQPDADVILSFRFDGDGVTYDVSRDGSISAIPTDKTFTVGTDTFTIYDAVTVTDSENGTTPPATYDVTFDGTAGDYTVTVLTIDSAFVFRFNGTTVSGTGDTTVTVSGP